MFKYNKSSNLYANIYRYNISKHNIPIKSNVKTYNVIAAQQNLQKIKNINMLDKIRNTKLAEKLNQVNNIKQNSIISQSNNLPKPRAYQTIKHNNTVILNDQKDIAKLLNKINENQIQQFKQTDQIAQKPVKVINQPSALINLLNSVGISQQQVISSNNTVISSNIITNNNNQQFIQQQQQKYKQQQQTNKQFKYVISNQQLLNKAKYIAETLQLQIYSNPQYNYYKLIQFVHNLYQIYGNNNMALMIICKGFLQFNKKQLVKLPEDKIADVIQYIILQIKKDK